MNPAWVEEQLRVLDLNGRDGLYTQLLTQEIPFWWRAILAGNTVTEEEVAWLIRRRGFNEGEQRKFRALAKFFNDNADRIRSES